MVRLSGMVICMNEAQRIGACLEALSFCDEVVVIDSGSVDGTLDIVKERGARLIERPFASQNDQKEFGRQSCRGEWVLSVDADEVVSPELAEEVRRIASAGETADAYRIPFRNYFRNAWVRRCGYYPDRHLRLVRRERAHWDVDAPVHDRVIVDGRVDDLRGHIDHYSFESLDDFLQKSRRYADGFAKAAHAAGQTAGVWTIGSHTLFRFFKAYVLKGGFLQGALGLTISGLQAYEVFQKYARLWELSRFGSEPSEDADVG